MDDFFSKDLILGLLGIFIPVSLFFWFFGAFDVIKGIITLLLFNGILFWIGYEAIKSSR